MYLKRNRGTRMKKSLLLTLCCVLLLGLTGCSKDQTKNIEALNLEVNDLKTEISDLSKELETLKNQDFVNNLQNGEFDCHNPYGIQKVKFLSSRVIYIYGVDETNDIAYNNYYVLNLVDKDKYEIVDEVVLPDSMPKRTIKFLRSEWGMGVNYMKEISILDSGSTLTISNVPLEVCTFVKYN
jgi:hypothetical protein